MPIPKHGRCNWFQVPVWKVRNIHILNIMTKKNRFFIIFHLRSILFRIIEMFLPISQYYAYAPQQLNRLRKKELKPHNGWTNDMSRIVENASRQQLNIAENSTMLHSTETTTEPNELIASSSSSSSTSSTSSSIVDHSLENSNNNRIWFF